MQAPLADFVTSTLNGAITNSATSATIGTGLNIPANDGVLQIDYDSTIAVGTDNGPETILYTAYDSGTGALSGITRGAAGTTAVAHDNGSPVGCGVSSLFFSIDPSWVASGETWTYVSATSFRISGDKTAKYAVGDKIKLTQTTAKYFYVTAVAYSSPNTTVTITGGTDYTLANAAITSPYYSKASSPVGFPQWFNWTPTLSGSGSMTVTSPTITKAQFKIDGRAMQMILYASATAGGTPSTALIFTTPVVMADANSAGANGTLSNGYQVVSWWNCSSTSAISTQLSSGGNYAAGAVNIKFNAEVPI